MTGLQPWLRPYAEYLIRHLAPHVTVTSVYRSYTRQLELYRQRATNPYPVAPPGCSQHNLGLAWDMTGPPEVLRWAGAVWRSWGGDWVDSDPIHFGVGGQPC